MIDLSTYRRPIERGAPRWKEAAWLAVKALLFRVPLPLPSAFRAAVLRAFGASIGEGFVIREGVDISMPWRFVAGDHVWIGEGVRILSLAEVRIGSHVCISQEAFLCTGSHRFDRPDFELEVRPIRINDRSWVAARAFIGPGVIVGSGSVVGANATVIRNVPDGCFVAGSPARMMRRFDGNIS